MLNAFDNRVVTANHGGIFLDELIGPMEVDTVHTIENVSLRTVNGSIRDARNAGAGDDAANVLGQTIDLDANGADADIGEFGNDLEIDSRRGSAPVGLNGDGDDVALEATRHIYLAETDQDLRLVFAHTYTGDIRITVQDTGGVNDNTGLEGADEDLELIDHGSARFAESNARQSNPDADRIFTNGQIFAEIGSITLIVGDDIETDANSLIMANGNIDIYGDQASFDGVFTGVDPDVGFGTNMILRGRIIANAVVTAGNQVGRQSRSGRPFRSSTAARASY